MHDHALIALGVTILLSIFMVWVMVSDVREYIIPNKLNLTLLLVWAAAMPFLPVDIAWSLAAAAVVMAVGMLFFAIGWMGAGDVKLLAALVLWTGWDLPSVSFLLLTAVAGGVLVIIVLPLRWFLAPVLFRRHPERNIPRILMKGQPVPYGIAIAMAFLLMLWNSNIPALNDGKERPVPLVTQLNQYVP